MKYAAGASGCTAGTRLASSRLPSTWWTLPTSQMLAARPFLESIADRQVRHLLSVGDTAAGQPCDGLPLETALEFQQEPGFTDARLPHKEHDLSSLPWLRSSDPIGGPVLCPGRRRELIPGPPRCRSGSAALGPERPRIPGPAGPFPCSPALPFEGGATGQDLLGEVSWGIALGEAKRDSGAGGETKA